MAITADKVDLATVAPLRAAFLAQNVFQIRYEACHHRGWADHYLLTDKGTTIGYGGVKGQAIPDRDTIFEFYLLRDFRSRAHSAFAALADACRPAWIECQTNEPQSFGMLLAFGTDIAAEAILFGDAGATGLAPPPGVRFRRRAQGESVLAHGAEPVGDFALEEGGRVVATGGFLTHYNPPFCDLYMEVEADRRGRGLASYLLQEVKREARLAGRVPAARTGMDNHVSRGALLRAGMGVCGYVLKARFRGAG